MNLDERQKLILALVIRDYIDHAQPVGSKTLVDKYGLNFSPAAWWSHDDQVPYLMDTCQQHQLQPTAFRRQGLIDHGALDIIVFNEHEQVID